MTTRRPALNEARETGRTAAGETEEAFVSRSSGRRALLLLPFVLLATLTLDSTHAAARSAAGSGQIGRNFYVSAEGSDANPGTSATTPWRTLAKVESASLSPGDHVHLQGGTRFTEPLAPFAGLAGTSGAPITFDSYGSGRATLAAGIYLNSVSNLTFADLDVTSTRKGIFSSAGGTGARAITLLDVTVSHVPLAGISSNNRSDSSWYIDSVTISHTGDSGVYFVGSNFTIAHSTIMDTGTNASIAYPRHGIYAAGPDPTIVDNVIGRSSTSGISLRYQDSVVEGNRIAGGTRGISFEEQAHVAGCTRIVFNTISGVSDSGIVVARPAIESFVVANNTIVDAAAYGMYFQAVPKLTIANNIVESSDPTAKLLSVRAATLSYSEHNNLWHGGGRAAFSWQAKPEAFGAYSGASGEGRSDRAEDPKLGDDFMPTAKSPAVDAGSTRVDASLRYRPSCDGVVFDYCGAGPDLGSHERTGSRSHS